MYGKSTGVRWFGCRDIGRRGGGGWQGHRTCQQLYLGIPRDRKPLHGWRGLPNKEGRCMAAREACGWGTQAF